MKNKKSLLTFLCFFLYIIAVIPQQITHSEQKWIESIDFSYIENENISTDVTEATVSLCENSTIILKANLHESATDTEWGWKKNSPDSAFLSGYPGNNENAAIFTKTISAEDADDYYFVVQKKSSPDDYNKDYAQVGITVRHCTSHLQLTSEIKSRLIDNDTVYILKLTINNDGEDVAHDVTIMNNLPQELTFDSFPNESKATQNAGSIMWFAEEIEAGAGKTLEIAVKINEENQHTINRAFVWQYDTIHLYFDYDLVQDDNLKTELTITDKNLVEFAATNTPAENDFTNSDDPKNIVEEENPEAEKNNDKITAEEDEKEALDSTKLLYEWIKNAVNSSGQYVIKINDDKKVEVIKKNGTPIITEHAISWPSAIIINEEKSSIADLNLEINIFNRYGVSVYEGKEGWDVTYNGKLADAGIYFYVIKFPDGEKLSHSIEIQKE